MAISTSISRLAAYYTRHGFAATVRRAGLAAKRALFSSRMILFYGDLSTLSSQPVELPSFLTVERHRNQAGLSPQDLREITCFWNPKLAARNVKERFQRGASVWLIKSERHLAGYGWTLQGHTVEPHYFPLGPADVHLFDFHVFPQYRGRGLNPLLVGYILRSLATECQGRAFIEAAEWNQPQLVSLRRAPVCRFGSARKFTLFRRTIVFWGDNEIVEQEQTDQINNSSIAPTRRKGSGLPDFRV